MAPLEITATVYDKPPEVYRYQGRVFRRLKSDGNAGLYAQDGKSNHFEVIRLNRKGHFPSPAQWGTDAYTCTTRRSAETRFTELVKRERERKAAATAQTTNK